MASVVTLFLGAILGGTVTAFVILVELRERLERRWAARLVLRYVTTEIREYPIDDLPDALYSDRVEVRH